MIKMSTKWHINNNVLSLALLYHSIPKIINCSILLDDTTVNTKNNLQHIEYALWYREYNNYSDGIARGLILGVTDYNSRDAHVGMLRSIKGHIP